LPQCNLADKDNDTVANIYTGERDELMIGTKEERLNALGKLYPTWDQNTLWTMFEKCCNRNPDMDFIVTHNNKYSYKKAKEEIIKMTRCLIALGVRKGTHVAMLMRNRPEFVFITFALARLGAVKIAINAATRRSELIYVLNQSDAEYFLSTQVIDDSLLKSISKLKKTVVWDKNYIYHSSQSIFLQDFYKAGETVTEKEVVNCTVDGKDFSELFDITFTSGSTSSPKGVMLTHDMLLRTAYGSCISRLFEKGRRICVPVPLYHNLGYVEGLLAAMLVNGAIIITTGKVTSEILYHMLVDENANDLLTVPSQMIDFFKYMQGKKEEFSSLHAVYSSASMSPKWVWGEIRKVFHVKDVITAFGMTEVTASTMQTKPDDPDDYVVRYVGTIKPGGVAGVSNFGGAQCQYVIKDLSTGKTLQNDQTGEICCKGLTVSKGYYKKDDINAQLFDQNGWMHTKDIGYFASNGYLVFLGRQNDSYKINGELVLPQFIDKIIGQCEQIRAVEVVGIRDDKCGEVGVAFIDPVDYSERTKTTIYTYCKDNLASFQVPKYFIFGSQDEWPRSASANKVPKFKLKIIAEEKIATNETWRPLK